MLKSFVEKINLVYFEVEDNAQGKILNLFKDGTEYVPETATDYFYLGYFYAHIEGNHTKAEFNYKKAEELGFQCVLNFLGELYEKQENYGEAEIYYRKAIASGELKCLVKLANLYGDHKKEFEKAELFYKMALEFGDASVIYKLAKLYLNVDRDKAESYLIMGSELGDKDSILALAHLYSEKMEYEKAIVCYHKIIGEMDVFYKMANVYYKIDDYDNAILYFKKSAEGGPRLRPTGSPGGSAMYNLGLIYRRHKKDYMTAISYYKQAIALGHKKAILSLAMLYDVNKGEYDNAEHYYNLAIVHGHTKAVGRLRDLYNKSKKYEEAFILTYKYESNNMLEALDKLTFPISSKNKMVIYPMLEKVEIPLGKKISTDIVYIMQDLGFYRQKLLCQLAYRYKQGCVQNI